MQEIDSRRKETEDEVLQEIDRKEETEEEFKPCQSDTGSDSTLLLDTEQSIYHSTLDSLGPAGRLVLDEEDKYDDIQWETGEGETVWVWVSLGSCHLDTVPGQWISDGNKSVSSLSSVTSAEEEPWRRDILQQLNSNKRLTEGECFQDFQQAIESSSWVKTSLVKVNTGGTRSRWEQTLLELELCGSKEGQVEFGTLSMFGQKSKTKEHVSLSEVSCVSVCRERASPQLAVFTPSRSAKLQPLLVKFSSDSEMEDWHGELVSSMNSLHGTTGTPSQHSVFSVTARGEVMVWDSLAATKAGEEENSVLGSQYSQGKPQTESINRFYFYSQPGTGWSG